MFPSFPNNKLQMFHTTETELGDHIQDHNPLSYFFPLLNLLLERKETGVVYGCNSKQHHVGSESMMTFMFLVYGFIPLHPYSEFLSGECTSMECSRREAFGCTGLHH